MRDLHTRVAGTVQTVVCTPIDILPGGVDAGRKGATRFVCVAVHARGDEDFVGGHVRCVTFAEGLFGCVGIIVGDTACIDVLEYSVRVKQEATRSKELTRVTA
jgi:hypothetical protein